MGEWDVNPNIQVLGQRRHSKASEEYLDVLFDYPDARWQWEGAVPIEYRRANIHAETHDEQKELLHSVYSQMHPTNHESWQHGQDVFWEGKPNATITKEFFDILQDSTWKCRICALPQNPNWARRVQDLKEFGYLISTNTNRYCDVCGKNTTQIILLRIPRQETSWGYETWSSKLRGRIMTVLGHHDVYEDQGSSHLLPDHKFPEIRWNEETLEENSDDMSEEDIRIKFQLLTNQRNQQKREVCRRCFQTGHRGSPFGIQYFYHGNESWPPSIPKTGINAEAGCVGCGWYDMAKWRDGLNKRISITG